jgi:hypothetical protein
VDSPTHASTRATASRCRSALRHAGQPSRWPNSRPPSKPQSLPQNRRRHRPVTTRPPHKRQRGGGSAKAGPPTTSFPPEQEASSKTLLIFWPASRCGGQKSKVPGILATARERQEGLLVVNGFAVGADARCGAAPSAGYCHGQLVCQLVHLQIRRRQRIEARQHSREWHWPHATKQPRFVRLRYRPR